MLDGLKGLCEGTTLPEYFYKVDDSGKPRPTLIFHGGPDSTNRTRVASKCVRSEVAQGIVSVAVSEEQMQLIELKLQLAARDLRLSYPDSGQPLTRRDSHKALRSSPSCHMTNGRHRRAHLQAR
jgi:hypothetical protein